MTRENRDSIRPEAVFAKLGEEVFVKPVHLGSSVGPLKRGIARAVVSDQMGLAADEAVLIEPLLVGQELTCGVLTESGER